MNTITCSRTRKPGYIIMYTRFDAPISNWFESNHSIWSILWQRSSFCIILNHISVTPRKKRPRVTSAVFATVGDDEVFLVDPLDLLYAPSIWIFYIRCCSWHRWPIAMDPLRTDVHDLTPHKPKATTCLKVLVLCLFCVFLALSVCFAPPSNPATQRTGTALHAKTNSASRQNVWRPAVKICSQPAVSSRCLSLMVMQFLKQLEPHLEHGWLNTCHHFAHTKWQLSLHK